MIHPPISISVYVFILVVWLVAVARGKDNEDEAVLELGTQFVTWYTLPSKCGVRLLSMTDQIGRPRVRV